jgi:transcriptional regulator with XRE-family HTH domain
MSSLLEQLRAARRERKIAQKALGERLGLPQSHVSAIEAGKVDPRLSSILEFARVLDLEPMLIPRDRVLAVRALLVRRALRCVESGNWLLADDIEAIWYRRPMPLKPREEGDRYEQAFVVAEWTAALEGYLAQVTSRRWINHPAAIMEAGSKLEQLRRAPRYGLVVPPWLCTLDRDEAIAFLREHDHWVVAKPLYGGYIERETSDADTVVYTSRVRPEDLDGAAPNLGAPTLFQRN